MGGGLWEREGGFNLLLTDPSLPPMGSGLVPGHNLLPKRFMGTTHTLEHQYCGEEAAGGKAAVMRRTFKAREAAAGPGRGPRETPTHPRGKRGGGEDVPRACKCGGGTTSFPATCLHKDTTDGIRGIPYAPH